MDLLDVHPINTVEFAIVVSHHVRDTFAADHRHVLELRLRHLTTGRIGP
jgi:hypothetical protein